MNYVFDPTWFKKHQKGLLLLCNVPVIKHWFRWVLRIHKDCKSNERIVELQPNNYKIDAGLRFFKRSALLETATKNTELNRQARRIAKSILKKVRKGVVEDKEFLLPALQADFRTHNKFSKRIFYAFYPIWWTFHQWDMLIANNFVPQLNLGFDTLTVYPDPGTATGNSVDGYVRVSLANPGDTFSNVRSGASGGTQANDTTATSEFGKIFAATTTDQYRQLLRYIATFNTASLGSGSTLSSATFSPFGTTGGLDNLGTASYNVYGATPASNDTLVAADYTQIGSTEFSTAIAFASWSTSAYNDFALNASGLSNISKTGFSKFSGREKTHDGDNVAPTWSSGAENNVAMINADTAGTSSDPKLVIIYTPGVVDSGFFLFM